VTTPLAAVHVRILLLKHDSFEAMHPRVAIGFELTRCDLHVFNQDPEGVRRACGLVRFGEPIPTLILLQQSHRNHETIDLLRRIREQPELELLPVAVLGDRHDYDSWTHARQDGADGFIPLPDGASGMARISEDVAWFWRGYRVSLSA